MLRLTAAFEALTGAAVLIRPETMAYWLFGDGVSGAGIAIGRIAGLALIGLALACWPDRAVQPDRPARAMFTYSTLAGIYLAYLGIVPRLAGVLLWPAVITHIAFSVGFVVEAWSRKRPASTIRNGVPPPAPARE